MNKKLYCFLCVIILMGLMLEACKDIPSCALLAQGNSVAGGHEYCSIEE